MCSSSRCSRMWCQVAPVVVSVTRTSSRASQHKIIGFVRSRPTPANAKVGDCMVGQSAKALKKIDCGDSKAEWTVVGRLEGKTEAETKDGRGFAVVRGE